jgi:hypothetical protein
VKYSKVFSASEPSSRQDTRPNAPAKYFIWLIRRGCIWPGLVLELGSQDAERREHMTV